MRDKRNSKVAMNYYVQLDGDEIILHGGLDEVITKDKKGTIKELRKSIFQTGNTREHFDLSKEKLDVAIVVYLQKQPYKSQDVDNIAKIVLDAIKKPKVEDGNPYFFEDDDQIIRLLVYKLKRKEDERANTCQISISVRKHDPKQEMELFVKGCMINGQMIESIKFSEALGLEGWEDPVKIGNITQS